MIIAGLPVPDTATAELAGIVRAAGADELADRLDQALADDVSLLALTIDERATFSASSMTRRTGSLSSARCS